MDIFFINIYIIINNLQFYLHLKISVHCAKWLDAKISSLPDERYLGFIESIKETRRAIWGNINFINYHGDRQTSEHCNSHLKLPDKNDLQSGFGPRAARHRVGRGALI